MDYKRTNILKLLLKALRTSNIDYKINQNHAVIFPNEYTLFFYLENRVIIHNRNTQISYDFNVFSINQLVILCSYFGVYYQSQKQSITIDIFKWLYYKPLPCYLSITNKQYKQVKINYK